MIPARVYHYRDPAAVILGLRELGKRGLTPRGLLFVAVDPRGETHIAIPDDLDAVTRIRVGDKLCLKPPWEGRYFHFDSIHRLPGDTVLWNGDRRLGGTGSAPEVACAISAWLKGMSAKSVYFGCTPHHPGSWWCVDERSRVIDLHATGLACGIVTHAGILSRRIGEPTLYQLTFADLRKGNLRDGWAPIYRSEQGNILMLERRVQNYRLVLTCERALVEIDVSGLPESVSEEATVEVESGLAVVGRSDAGTFAVTRGRPEPWGMAELTPALLVGGPSQALLDLPSALSEAEA